MPLSVAKRAVLFDPFAGNPVPLKLSNVINDAVRAAGVQGDGLAPNGTTGIWPAATNIVLNGGFESNVTGYIANKGGETITRDTSSFKFGAASIKCVTPNVQALEGWESPSLTVVSATAYILSAFVWGSGTIVLQSDGSGGSGTQTSTITLTATPTRYSLAFTSGAGTGLLIRAVTPTQQAATFYCDGLQCELGSVMTPYIETNGGTASRVAGRVQVPMAGFTPNSLGFAVRFRYGWSNAGEPASDPGQFNWRLDGSNYILMRYVLGGTNRFFAVSNAVSGATDAALSAVQSPNVGDYVTVVGEVSPTLIGLAVNGGAFVTASRAAGVPSGLPASADIGSRSSGATGFGTGDFLWAALFSNVNFATSASVFLNNFQNNDPTARQIKQQLGGRVAVWNGRGSSMDVSVAV